MYFPFSKFTLLYTLSIDELFFSLKIVEILLIWGKIKWLFVTYGMFQKMFLLQSSPLLADIAVFLFLKWTIFYLSPFLKVL